MRSAPDPPLHSADCPAHSFTDPLPSGLIVATLNGLNSSCGGTVTAAAGSGSIGLANGNLPANGQCTLAVSVTAQQAGSFTNVTGNVSALESGSGGTATASITVQSSARNCGGLLSGLATLYGGLRNAAAILEFSRVQELGESISLDCRP